MNDLSVIADVLDRARALDEHGQWDAALEIYHEALAKWQTGAPGAELLRKIGIIHHYRGDFQVAQNLFESSRRVATESGASLQVANATHWLAIVKQAQGQLDVAEGLYQAARRLAWDLGAVRLMVQIDQNLGIVAGIRGDTARALACYEAALEAYLVLEEELPAARVLNNIGMACATLERWADAETAFQSALAKAEGVPHPETVGTVQLNRAELYCKLERFDDARACCDQAFEIFARLESKSGLGETYKAYGVLYRQSGKLHLAEAHLSLVAELAQAADHPLLEAEAEEEYALVHLAKGENREALKSLNRAHFLFADLKARLALTNVDRQLDQLEARYLEVVQVWGESIESKDRYTAGHCSRVADYTCRMAEAIGITGRDLTWIRMGAFLHDVGKTTIDAAVLNKPGSLDKHEWEEMRRHTVAGDEIVSDLGFPYDIRPMVRSHHERWDGRGYPDQLAGVQIPLIARILCIADTFDALTTTRSYRTAFSQEQAIRIMKTESSGNFDPALLATFCALLGDESSVHSNA